MPDLPGTARGFRAMQFNFVVSTNGRAIRLWESFGPHHRMLLIRNLSRDRALAVESIRFSGADCRLDDTPNSICVAEFCRSDKHKLS